MDNKALPPIEKIYEAYSAIADSRVRMSAGSALVTSSDYAKEYTVEWNDGTYSSNDNASYWQGYLGYPIISVLMLQDRLNYNPAFLEYFKDINWKKLNKENKNDYSRVVRIILEMLSANDVDIKLIKQDVAAIYDQIKTLDVNLQRSSKRPPKSK